MFVAQDIKAAQNHLRKIDPIMKRIIKQVGPFTLKLKRDRFKTLVGSIISQQISTTAANTIQQRLIDAVAPNQISAESLSQFDIDGFRELGVSRQKATYIIDIVEKSNSGELQLNKLGRMTDEDAIEHLCRVKGIGRWTAQMLLIFSIGRLDVMAVDDLGLKNAVKLAYELDEHPASDQFHEIADAWKPYRSIASWYLWQSLKT